MAAPVPDGCRSLLAELAWLLILRGERSEAARHLARARAIVQQGAAPPSVAAKVSCFEGWLATLESDLPRGLRLLEGTLSVAQREGDQRELAATAEAGIGRARLALGGFEEAERALRSASAQLEAIDSVHPSIVGALYHFHRVYERSGRNEEAEKVRRRAAEAGAEWAQRG